MGQLSSIPIGKSNTRIVKGNAPKGVVSFKHNYKRINVPLNFFLTADKLP